MAAKSYYLATTRTVTSADIEIQDRDGVVLADVYVEIHDGKVQVVITDHIAERDSDEPTQVIELLKEEGPCQDQ